MRLDLKRGHLLGRGGFRHCHQNLRRVDFVLCRAVQLLVTHELINLSVSHAHAGIHLTLANTRQQQLVAQLAAELRHAQSVGHQTFAQLLDIDPVLLRHAQLSLVHHALIHAQTHFPGQLHLRFVTDHALQHHACELAGAGLGATCLRQLLNQARDLNTNLAVGDRLGVDNSDYEIPLLRAVRTHPRCCQ